MRKILLAFTALASCVSAASAADIVTYQQPEQPVKIQQEGIDWNGLYAGGSVGGSWASSRTALRGTNGYSVTGGPGLGEAAATSTYGRIARKTLSPSSFLGGLYAGYNFQVPQLNNIAPFLHNVVFGVETSWFWNGGGSDGKREFGIPVNYGDGSSASLGGRYSTSVRERWNGSTDIRIGYALGPQDRFLPYFRVGVAYGDIHARSRVYGQNGDGSYSSLANSSKTDTRAGWDIGGGLDYVPPILNDHLILRAEYRYTDLGAGRMSRYGSDPALASQGISYQLNQHVKYNQNDFRVGVAYKF